MKRDLAYAMEDKSHVSAPSLNANDVSEVPDLESNGAHTPVHHSRAAIVRVYTRNKRCKSQSKDLVSADSSAGLQNGNSLQSELMINEAESTSGMETISVDKSGNFEVEVKLDPADDRVKSDGKPRRFTRSALKGSVENPETIINGDLEGLVDVTIVEAEIPEEGSISGFENLDIEVSKRIDIFERPATVKELLATGWLEGYPVFYNGGKKGIPLRGTIMYDGILCSCNICQGVKVVPPCQFEIHACKTYRRASQYICLENGRSLLDVVKECRKGSLKMLEDTVQGFIGPLPAKESIVCQNCKSQFLATSAGKVDQLCDSCMIAIKSENCVMHTPYARIGEPEPVLKLQSPESVKVKISRTCKHRGRKKRKFSEMAPKQDAFEDFSGSSSGRKSQWKLAKEFSKSTSAFKSRGSASVSYSSKSVTQTKMLKSSPPKLLKSASASLSNQSKAAWKITKKDQRMHWLVFQDGGLPDGTELAYFSRGQKLLEGYKKGLGILCSCCNSEVSPSQFEAHAGWASRKKPYGYIYMSNGVSLHEFALSLLKGRKYTAAEDNDDLCIICADGGKLVLCDGCPRAFHKECASLSSIPRGKWYCKYCENMFQRERFVEYNANALAAGRVPGVDAIEQITSRCIRIVKDPDEAEVIACVICRGYDFSKSGFGPRTVILCDQCEKEYHVGCLKKQKMADLKELPKGKWFCCGDCRRIYGQLHNLLTSGSEKLPTSCLDLVSKKLVAKELDAVADIDVRWRLLSGKITTRETRLLLSEAVAIFHDSFDPIIDVETGRDFIPCLVYGRNIRGQDFGGMYCAIVTVNSQVISAGILRIFGQDMAELPLVATRKGYQGKGYFQLLFSCIEKLLAFMRVRSLVLPAAEEAESIWTKRFGFKKIGADQLANVRKTCWQMINFKGTSMLEKAVPKCRIIHQDKADSDEPARYINI